LSGTALVTLQIITPVTMQAQSASGIQRTWRTLESSFRADE